MGTSCPPLPLTGDVTPPCWSADRLRCHAGCMADPVDVGVRRLHTRSRGRWLVRDAAGAETVWTLTGPGVGTWERQGGPDSPGAGPFRIARVVEWPTVGAVCSVIVDDPAVEWTRPGRVIVSRDIAVIWAVVADEAALP